MKKSLLLLVLFVSALVLASCTNVQRSEQYNVLKISDIENKETKITFKVRSGVISTALEELVDAFHQEYPYIEVEVATITGNYDLLRSSTILDINSKNKENVPDLLIGYPDHFAEYYEGSNLVDLQYFIDDKNVGLDEEEMADFIAGYLPENRGFKSGAQEDHLFGLPFNKSTEVMVYNKTAFQVLFGDNYEDKIPKTWEEVKTVGAEIVAKVKAGELDNTFEEDYDPDTKISSYLKVSDYLSNPQNIQFVPFGYDSADNGFITLIRHFGAKYTQRESISKGYIYFNNPEARAAMTYFQNMTNEGLFATAATFGAQYNSEAFQAIKVLMTVGSSAGVGYNSSVSYDYELGFAPIPYYEADKKYVIQQGTNIGMLNHNNDEEKLASWLFIKFLMRPENTAAFAMATGGYLPVKQSAYATEEYVKYLGGEYDDKKEFAAAANVALNSYIEENYIFFVDDAFVGSSKVREEAGRIFDSVIVSKENVATRFEKAYANLRPFVPKS